MVDVSTTSACPQCGEYVAPAMFRCRSCGWMLPERVRISATEPATAKAEESTRREDAARVADVSATSRSASEVSNPQAEVLSSSPAAFQLEGQGVSSAGKPARAGRIVKCRCGATLRLRGEAAPQNITCPRCQMVLKQPTRGSGESAAQRGASSSETLDFREEAQALERVPPVMAQPQLLGRTRLGWQLRRIARRLERQDSDHSEAAIERRKALFELAETQDERVIEWIISTLEDPWENVRQGAVAALGQLGDPRAVPALVRCLADPTTDVRREAVLSLGKIGDARAVRALLAIAVQDPHLRFLALDSLVRVGPPGLSLLVKSLDQSDPGLVLQALLALQRIGASSAAEAISRLLGHRTATLRAQAAEALGALGNKSVIPRLREALDDQCAAVRVQAVRSLMRLGDKKSAKVMAALLADDDRDVRVAVLEALAVLGDATHEPAVLPFLQDSDAVVRQAAASALQHLATPAAVGPLMARLDDPDEAVRLKVVGALGHLKAQAALPTLQRMLSFPTPAIRAKVAEALGELGQPSAIDALATSLQGDPAVEVRLAAARALGRIKDTRAIPALEAALLAPNEVVVRCRVIMALGEIGSNSSQAALLAMLRDVVPEVRYQAALALGEVGNAHARRSLETLLGDENPLVRRGAAKALIKLGDPRGEALLDLAAQDMSARKRDPVAARNHFLRIVLAGVGLLALAAAGTTGWYFSRGRQPVLLPTQTVPRGKVSALAFSADGQGVLVGRTRGRMEMWDLSRRQRIEDFEGQNGVEITHVALAARPGDVYFAAGTQVYRRFQGRVTPLQTHKAVVAGLRSAPGGHYGWSWSRAGDVIVWNLDAGLVMAQRDLAVESLATVAVDAEGHHLAWGTSSGTVELWSLKENERQAEISLESEAVTVLDWHPQGERLAVATAEGRLWLCHLGEETSVRRLNQPADEKVHYRQMKFTSDGQHLLALTTTTVERYRLEGEGAPETRKLTAPTDLWAIDPTGNTLVCGSREHAGFWVLSLTEDQPPQRFGE